MSLKNIHVYGLGNMGAAFAMALANHHRVTGIDIDRYKVKQMNEGHVPHVERTGDAMLQQLLAANRFEARTEPDPNDPIAPDCIFIGVQTPVTAAGEANYDVLERVLTQVGALDGSTPDCPVVILSTLFPGYLERYAGRLSRRVFYHPVFLRAGFGVEDTMMPAKIIIGHQRAATIEDTLEVSGTIDSVVLNDRGKVPRHIVPWVVAEWAKMIHNSFMTAKICFVNEWAKVIEDSLLKSELCNWEGVSPSECVSTAMDEGSFGRLLTHSHMNPGPPYSGACLPKDARAARRLAKDMDLIAACWDSREEHIEQIVRKALECEANETVLIVGAAMRPGSDELRDSLCLELWNRLRPSRKVAIWDPIFEKRKPEQIAKGDGEVFEMLEQSAYGDLSAACTKDVGSIIYNMPVGEESDIVKTIHDNIIDPRDMNVRCILLFPTD